MELGIIYGTKIGFEIGLNFGIKIRTEIKPKSSCGTKCFLKRNFGGWGGLGLGLTNIYPSNLNIGLISRIRIETITKSHDFFKNQNTSSNFFSGPKPKLEPFKKNRIGLEFLHRNQELCNTRCNHYLLSHVVKWSLKLMLNFLA